MAEAESLRQVAHSRAPFSAWFGTLLLFALFGVIVLALVGPLNRKDSYEQTRAKKRIDFLKGQREQDAKTLTTYGWVDQAKGSAHIPIDRAMELTVTELAQKKPAPAYPIATPAPAAVTVPPGPSPAPSVAASATPSPVPSLAPAGAVNPPAAKPSTPPGASATPQTSPAAPSGKPAVSPSGTPNQSPPGSPSPVAGQTPATS